MYAVNISDKGLVSMDTIHELLETIDRSSFGRDWRKYLDSLPKLREEIEKLQARVRELEKFTLEIAFAKSKWPTIDVSTMRFFTLPDDHPNTIAVRTGVKPCDTKFITLERYYGTVCIGYEERNNILFVKKVYEKKE